MTTSASFWLSVLETVERIAVAAIKNLETGAIIKCPAHSIGYEMAVDEGWFPEGCTIEDVDYVQDGFITTAGRFLDRAQAHALARSVGQTSDRGDRHWLDSENLIPEMLVAKLIGS